MQLGGEEYALLTLTRVAAATHTHTHTHSQARPGPARPAVLQSTNKHDVNVRRLLGTTSFVSGSIRHVPCHQTDYIYIYCTKCERHTQNEGLGTGSDIFIF